MKQSTKRGFGFGLTSGIITTLGILMGLYSTTQSKLIILVGIISVAIADAFSDALGIHLSEESNTKVKHSEVWKSTFATFFSKLIFAGILLIPVLIFDLKSAVLISSLLGIIILGIFSYKIANQRKENPFKKILEHVSIAILVIIITYSIGKVISI